MPKSMKQLSFAEIRSDILKRIIKDKSFKAEFIKNPKEILSKDYGITFPNNAKIKILEDTEQLMHFVIPVIPEGKLTDAQLTAIAGGSVAPSKSRSEGIIIPPAGEK